MVDIKRTMTVASAESDCSPSVEEVEAKITSLLERYATYDTQAMCTPFSDEYCREAQDLLRDLDDALKSPAAA